MAKIPVDDYQRIEITLYVSHERSARKIVNSMAKGLNILIDASGLPIEDGKFEEYVVASAVTRFFPEES
jgi:hypothetical protein